MNWVDKLGRTDEGVTIGRCKFSRLLFANDLVLLASSESGLQHALNGFAATCDIAGHRLRNIVTLRFVNLSTESLLPQIERSQPCKQNALRTAYQANFIC